MTRYSIWVVSPPNYPHSQCFNEVAIGLQAAFRALSLEAGIVREPSQLGDITIVLGCNLLPFVTVPPRKRLVLFNLEQITPGSFWLNKDYLLLLGRYPVWTIVNATLPNWGAWVSRRSTAGSATCRS